ncbi:MAG TPA: plastocyanin/azurin family copper-binding protein, partial [Thermoanaerobaculia bacterium]
MKLRRSACAACVARSALVLAIFTSAGPARADQTVTIGPGFSFNPSTVTIAPGERVTWTWVATGHSTTSDTTAGPEVWDSGIQALGASFSHAFATPGSHPYYCKVHSVAGGTFMNGVVQVVAPPATPTPTVTALLSPTPTPPAAAGPGGAIPTLDEMGLAL